MKYKRRNLTTQQSDFLYYCFKDGDVISDDLMKSLDVSIKDIDNTLYIKLYQPLNVCIVFFIRNDLRVDYKGFINVYLLDILFYKELYEMYSDDIEQRIFAQFYQSPVAASSGRI